MQIDERQLGDVTVLALSGRLTVADEQGLLKQTVAAALAGGARSLLLDLSGLRYIDSTRLGELITAHISVSRQGGRLALVDTPERIVDLLRLAGLDGIFLQFPTVDEAVRLMKLMR